MADEPSAPKDATSILTTPGGVERFTEAFNANRKAFETDQAQPPDRAPTPPDNPPLPAIELDRDAPLVSSFLPKAVGMMLRRARGEEKPIPLPWPTVTQKLAGGLWPGLHVLVGNTASGKSQLALQIALHAARMGTPVLYIGLELGQTGLVARLLGLMSGRRWSRLWLGENESELLEVVAKHQEELESLPFRLEFGPPGGWSYDRLWETVDQLKARHGGNLCRPLVVLDYLQLIASPQNEPSRELRERIGRAAYFGRAVAREHQAAVLLVSSTARDKYRTLNGHPDPKNATSGNHTWEKWRDVPHMLAGCGKESGEVEYSADSLLVLVRGEFVERDPTSTDADNVSDRCHYTEMHLALAKVRAGIGGWCDLCFNGGEFWEPQSSDPSQKRGRPMKLSQLGTLDPR